MSRMGRRSTDLGKEPSAGIIALIGAIAAVLLANQAFAQELDPRVAQRCLRSSALVVAYDDAGNELHHGSGSVIGSDGYVLTNFHVVGSVDGFGPGRPGDLFNSHNVFGVGIAASAREAVSVGYFARVVRADVGLDLALLRIFETVEGDPLSPRSRFSTIELSRGPGVQPGTRVWAIGFPLDVETINITGGLISGFQMNAENQVAWLRTDAEFNPGNSGGMLVDSRCRLVGIPTAVDLTRTTIEPIELARPSERVPDTWMREMRRGTIGVAISGDEVIARDSVVPVAMIGDSGASDERRFFRIADAVPYGVVEAIGAAPILALVDDERNVIRFGVGRVEILPSDSGVLDLAVLVEDSARNPMRFEISLRIPRTAQTSPSSSATCPAGASLVEGRCRCSASTPTWDERGGRCVASMTTSSAPNVSGGVRATPPSSVTMSPATISAARSSFAVADADTARVLSLSIQVRPANDSRELREHLTEAFRNARTTIVNPYVSRMREVEAFGVVEFIVAARISAARARSRFVDAVWAALNSVDYRGVTIASLRARFAEEIQRRGYGGEDARRELDLMMRSAVAEGTVDSTANELRDQIDSEVGEIVDQIKCGIVVDLVTAMRLARVARFENELTLYALSRIRSTPISTIEQCVQVRRVSDPSIPPYVSGEF